MEKSDKKNPHYSYHISILFRQFIHDAYFATGIVKPNVGVATLSACIIHELESIKQDDRNIREFNRLKTELAKAIDRYSKEKKFQEIKKPLIALRDIVARATTFDKLIEIMLQSRELMGEKCLNLTSKKRMNRALDRMKDMHE